VDDQEQVAKELEAIRSLRAQGLISPREAYERHLAAIAVPIRPDMPLNLGGAPVATGSPALPASIAPPLEQPHKPASLGLYLFGLLFAILGGPLGILGAFVQELQAGALVIFLGAPIIEEALKPAGIYLLLLQWPHALRGRLHTALLAAISGLCFGIIESMIYVTLYYPNEGSDFVLFRFTVPLFMHAFASFLVGLGLSRSIIDWAAGRSPLPNRTRNFYLAAVGVHAAYNTLAVILSVAGFIEFSD
jgi:hypothetical protein